MLLFVVDEVLCACLHALGLNSHDSFVGSFAVKVGIGTKPDEGKKMLLSIECQEKVCVNSRLPVPSSSGYTLDVHSRCQRYINTLATELSTHVTTSQPHERPVEGGGSIDPTVFRP